MRTWSHLAAAPDTWADPDAMSALEALLVFGGGTVGLVVLISFLVVAPSLIRGARHRQSGDWWAEPLWFGGPTGELDEDASTERRQLAAPAEPAGEPVGESTGGGAGARW